MFLKKKNHYGAMGYPLDGGGFENK